MGVRSIGVGAALLAFVAAAAPAQADPLDRVEHFVILMQENNSFDKLYGGWEGVDGLGAPATQRDQSGRRLDCLLQTATALQVPPLTQVCTGVDAGGERYASHFGAGTFRLNDHSLPKSEGDIRHGFYQERYQINGGAMDRFVVGNDASAGLAMGMWDTRALPLYRYLHSAGAPRYVIADRFFHAAFGGSFLNHQWIVAARTPRWPGAPESLHAVVDAAGMPGTYPRYPLYTSPSKRALRDGSLTAACDGTAVPCGDYVVNTAQPEYQPHLPGARTRVPPLTGPTIGSRLTKAGVSWAWYAQGWSNAAGRRGAPGWTNGKRKCTDPDTLSGAKFPYCPSERFSFHHHAFNYFKAFSPKTAKGRANRAAHLKDYAGFRTLTKRSADRCRLRDVSFVKFTNAENEHPGGGGPNAGSRATVRLLKSVVGGACAKDTMVIVVYDENGGAWDHVAPPPATAGPSDRWGPGTRTPALVVAPGLAQDFAVDSVSHDSTSVAKTLQVRYGLAPLGARDRAVSSLESVWTAPAVG